MQVSEKNKTATPL